MDFLTAALLYTIFALFAFGLFWLGQPLLQRVLPRRVLSLVQAAFKWVNSSGS